MLKLFFQKLNTGNQVKDFYKILITFTVLEPAL